jgi:hypothetical protein
MLVAHDRREVEIVQQGGDEQVEVGPELVEMAACDGQQLGRLNEGAGPAARTHHAHGGAELDHVDAQSTHAHHRALHRGELVIEGAVATGLRFRHADGSVYGPEAIASRPWCGVVSSC